MIVYLAIFIMVDLAIKAVVAVYTAALDLQGAMGDPVFP